MNDTSFQVALAGLLPSILFRRKHGGCPMRAFSHLVLRCYVIVHNRRAEGGFCHFVQELRLRNFNVLICF